MIYTYEEIYDFENKLREDIILRVEDNAIIPKDESNSDYQAYLKYLEENN